MCAVPVSGACAGVNGVLQPFETAAGGGSISVLGHDGGAWLRSQPGSAMVPGVGETGGVLKMSPVFFREWKMQGLVDSPPSFLAVLGYSACFFLVLHLKTLSHRLTLLCHSQVGELSATRKH